MFYLFVYVSAGMTRAEKIKTNRDNPSSAGIAF